LRDVCFEGLQSRMDTFEIRARYDAASVRVYQAYSAAIASPALAAQRFVPPFKLSRMTWIKPSFNWMMYRSGFATKPDQEVVLAIDIIRDGFEWALENAVLSTFHHSIHGSHDTWCNLLNEKPVRVQWDPERDWRLHPIENVRAIQIGLSGEAVHRYVHEWITRIDDVTPMARKLREAAATGQAPAERPDERETVYPLTSPVAERLVPRA
jgi:hypothetical protein